MPSDVDICNLGLVMLGAARIMSFQDNSKSAKEARAIYAMQRDAELEAHTWSFATKLTTLPATTVPPEYQNEFTIAYNLPADYLRAIQVGDIYPSANAFDYRAGWQADYQIMGGQILTGPGWPIVPNGPSLPPLNLMYVWKVSESGLFNPLFVRALAAQIAWTLCETITQSTQKQTMAMQAYKLAITEAVRVKAVQKPPDQIADSAWILSRY